MEIGIGNDQAGYEALLRLFKLTTLNTIQARCAANLLLACYDAPIFGGWDPTEIWKVDEATGSDMLSLLQLVKWSGLYIDELGFDKEIQLVWRKWMQNETPRK